MYLGIDIGGTKTLVASLNDEGVITQSIKFPTPEDYDQFLSELDKTVASLETKDFRAGCLAAPGRIDRKLGVGKSFSNLPWRNVPLQQDIERIAGCPMLVENDANLAGLSEAMLLKDKHAKVLYITISTGIGTGYIVSQQIDPSMEDSEGGLLQIQRGDQIVKWESFASGHAIAERYGKHASEIEDEATWRTIATDLSVGFIDLIAVTQPDIIVVGGGVGRYLDKFHDLLVAELKKYENPMLPIPPIANAGRAEEAVIYGCYDLARARYA
jgi:predicted NBD/HSP70 family sugar kinase